MRNKIFPYILLTPALLIFTIFIGVPIILTISGSITFHDTPFFASNISDFIKDEMLWKSVRNTIIILLFYLLLKIPTSIILGYLISTLKSRKRLILTIIFIPSTIGGFAYGVIFRFLFSSSGIINSLLGQSAIGFLDSELWIKFVIAFALFIATFGQMTLLMLFSIQNNISQSLFDLITIDGGTMMQKLKHVIIPLLRPLISLFIVFAILETVALIGMPLQLSQGGPNNASLTIGYYIYKQAIEYGHFSYASFLSILVVFVLVWIIVLPKSLRQRGYTYEEY